MARISFAVSLKGGQEFLQCASAFIFLTHVFFLIQQTPASRPEVSIERAILNRFAHMLRLYLRFPFEVGKRAAHFQYAIISPRRQAQPRDRIFQQCFG